MQRLTFALTATLGIRQSFVAWADSWEWQCHHFAEGQDEAWCRYAGVQDHVQYQFFGPASPCGKCWCCRRNASALEAEPLPYNLYETYAGRDFFSHWEFWTDPDPTHGAIEYVGHEVAVLRGLAKATEQHAYIGVENTMELTNASIGRQSVRIHSKTRYQSGLFIVEVEHMPTGCGTWPAFWMYGEDDEHLWPKWGEFDIIEVVHTGNSTMTTLHTGKECSQTTVKEGTDFTGWWSWGKTGRAANCYVNEKTQYKNQGCAQFGPEGSAGAMFNERGGGTFAAEWDPVAGHIRTWFWPKGSMPDDVRNQTPRPATWGKPYSKFKLEPHACDPSHFKNMQLVFNADLCGDFGDSTFADSCPEARNKTCKEFISDPESVSEAYWSIRGLHVYMQRQIPHDLLPSAGGVARQPKESATEAITSTAAITGTKTQDTTADKSTTTDTTTETITTTEITTTTKRLLTTETVTTSAHFVSRTTTTTRAAVAAAVAAIAATVASTTDATTSKRSTIVTTLVSSSTSAWTTAPSSTRSTFLLGHAGTRDQQQDGKDLVFLTGGSHPDHGEQRAGPHAPPPGPPAEAPSKIDILRTNGRSAIGCGAILVMLGSVAFCIVFERRRLTSSWHELCMDEGDELGCEVLHPLSPRFDKFSSRTPRPSPRKSPVKSPWRSL